MMKLSICVIAAIALAPPVSGQSIPLSVQAAEAEGAAHPHAAAPAYTPIAFTNAFTGSAERKCTVLEPSTEVNSSPVRSGEMIVRARLTGPFGLEAGREHKIYWQPLHNPFEFPDTLVIRAVRIDSPTDLLRVSVSNWGYSPGRKQESGFPSQVRFPTAGNWLVIATAGSDWGCFVWPVTAP